MAEDPFDDDEHHPDEWDGEKPTDTSGTRYNPYTGSTTPAEGRCNALLTNYQERYGEKRYCMGMPEATFVDDGSQFCKNHKGRAEQTMERAKDLYETGVNIDALLKFYDRMDPLKEFIAIATFDYLLEASTYDFAINLREHDLDLSASEYEVPAKLREEADEDGVLSIGVPVPTRKGNRWKPLWHAALDEVKKININEELMANGLEGETVVATGTNEAGHIVDQVTEKTDHHLNLPYDRLVRNHGTHLEEGGVITDEEGDQTQGGPIEEMIVNVDPETVSEDTKEMPLHDDTDLDPTDIEPDGDDD